MLGWCRGWDDGYPLFLCDGFFYWEMGLEEGFVLVGGHDRVPLYG